MQKTINVPTRGNGDIHGLDKEVCEAIRESGVERGVVHIFNVGSTAAIGTIELEPGLSSDLPDILNELIPPGTHYGHEQTWRDGNAHSHLQATLLGPSLTVPIRDGQPVLGTWQQIILLECDNKPRERSVIITVTPC